MNPARRLYDRHVLPHVVRWACSGRVIERQRQKVVPLAQGRVLEVGVGGGLNLPHYDPAAVEHLVGVDPSPLGLRQARRVADSLPFPVDLQPCSAEALPLPDASVDSVVLTYTLCTVPDPAAALAEVRRVLAPGGRLLFSEHGRAPQARVARWQRRLEPVWKVFGGGCHLTRDAGDLLRAANFALVQLDAMDLPGPSIARHHTWGVARAV